MSLKTYTIICIHPVNRRRLTVLGQGGTPIEALADAAKTMQIPFRPKADGKRASAARFNVTLTDGTKAALTMEEFETP